MKHMSWSWGDLMEAPRDIVNEIVEMINDEIDRHNLE